MVLYQPAITRGWTDTFAACIALQTYTSYALVNIIIA